MSFIKDLCVQVDLDCLASEQIASPARAGAFPEERRQQRLRRRTTCCEALQQHTTAYVDERWEQIYFHVAMQLDAASLRAMDATGCFARDANKDFAGRWRTLGHETFLGKELCGEGSFVASAGGSSSSGHKVSCWKQQYTHFTRSLKTFSEPFESGTIRDVAEDDEVAYFKCVLRADQLTAESPAAAYLEVEVRANPDNFSLALVDFDEGGASSLTFSPDTGAVISERKVCESPRKVQGMFVQPLDSIASETRFLGRVGLYIQGGRIAFFRQLRAQPADTEAAAETEAAEAPEDGPWETTGFVTDLGWAEGKRVSPCIAFRSAGHYEVEVTRADSHPPFVPHIMGKDNGLEWAPLDWEAPQNEEEEE